MKHVPEIVEMLKDMPHQWEEGYYSQFVAKYDEEHYLERVRMAQFEGRGKVLDAGCGFGQWAIALAWLNGHVVGVDYSESLVKAARLLAKAYNVDNVEFRHGELPHLEFPDEEFDLIWCWGVLMFVNRRETLREFHRLLRPGGRLLVGSANSRGRWLKKALDSLNPRNKRLFSLKRFRNCMRTFWRGGDLDARPNCTPLKSCKKLCEEFGFRLIAADYDGHIDLSGQGRRRPMFAPRFLLWESNIEFIGEKVASVAGSSACP